MKRKVVLYSTTSLVVPLQNKEDTKKQAEPVKKIDVDKSMLISTISDYYSNKGFGMLGLILAYENKDVEMYEQAADNLIKNMIVEVVKGSKSDNDDAAEKVSGAINLLVDKFKLKNEDYFVFVRNQYRFLENLRLEFRFIKADKNSSTLLFRLEEELYKSLDFINVMTSYPFFIDLEKDVYSLNRILALIEYLENVVECMFLYENEVLEERKNEQDDLDDSEEGDVFSAASRPGSIKKLEDYPNQSNKIKVRDTVAMKKPGKKLRNEDSQHMAELWCKIRASFLLHISMILLSYLIKKFEFIRPLLYDLRSLLFSGNETATDDMVYIDSQKEADKNRQSLANIQIYLKNLKEIATSLLSKAESKEEKKQKLEDESDSDDDLFMKNFKKHDSDDDEYKEKKRKEEERIKRNEEQKIRIEEFMIIWLRQVIIYNTHFILNTALANQNMMSILDVRPSIIKATSIKYSLVSLINPRLQALQQVNNFKSMKRVIDNIATYFFQNFISTSERAMITEDLAKVHNNLMKMESLKHLNFKNFFESNQEFKEFCSFMDLNYYISNICELELSLIYHTNKNSSQSTQKRVNEIYKNGIEVFKFQGEHITQLWFDKCENDIMAFTMKEEGIREIKLLQSLTLRNRTELGLDVFDTEYDNWSDWLHRYDNYPKEDAIKSQHQPILGAITSLYKDKTVSFSKIKRANKSHIYSNTGGKSKIIVSEIEQKPPSIWNGSESSDFLKVGSMKKGVSHLDYSTCIAAHPMLPLYVTGNNKGKLCVWPFNNFADSTVGNEYETYRQKNKSSKKLTIEKCSFSSYGDKLAALNSDGTLFMFNFNMHPASINPFFKQKSEKDLKYRDFDFLNRDTIIAAISKRSSGIAIYDLLLPNNQHLTYTSPEIGGTKLCTLERYQQILAFNGTKNGTMKIFDIRMQKLMNEIQLWTDEITAITLSKDQRSLVTGTKDGIVKIWNIDKEFELRESINAFIDIAHNKKHEVSCVIEHPLNNALFASSYDGTIKLLRLQI